MADNNERKDSLYAGFEEPEAFYRPAPFWIWNEEMDDAEVERQLEEIKSHGFGGAFEHVRNGLITPYLGEEYFAAFGNAIEKAKSLGMKLYMYDEYGWPSGAAGGKVIKEYPDARIHWLFSDIKSPDDLGADRPSRRVFEYDEETMTIGKELTALGPEAIAKLGKKVMVTFIEREGGEFPSMDLSKPGTTETFIKTTHEEYYKRFGKDFKEHLMAMFSDESYIAGVYTNRTKLLYNEFVTAKFYEMHGYRLEDNCNYLAVFDNYKGNFDRPAVKVRYDYMCTLHQLWIDSFIKPIAKWCEEHDIAWTGHDQEHSWPRTTGGAFSEQHTYEYRQWPGIDMLLCEGLKHEPACNDTFLMNEARSAANQFGKKRVICEAYGAAGWHSTFRDYKRVGDWLMVNGINFMIQHLTHYSIVGARKRDCPQSFDWRQPWWDEYTEYNDYFGRLSYILSQGRMEQRILVLNPSTTGYLVEPYKQTNHIDHTTVFDSIKNPDVEDLLRINQKLIDGQWDFDYGDEFSIEDNASIDRENKKFTLGLQSYDVVVVSKNMLNLRRPTAKLLLEFMAAGGKVVCTGDAGEYIDGELGDELTGRLRAGWTIVDGEDGVERFLSENLEKRVRSAAAFPTGINHERRVFADGTGREAYFFVNHTMKHYTGEVTLRGKRAAVWNCFDGTKKALKCRQDGEFITFTLDLEWNQSLLIVVGDEAPEIAELPSAEKKNALRLTGIRPEKTNHLVLDHCRMTLRGKTSDEKYFMQFENEIANTLDYNNQNVWMEMQYESRFLDLNAGFDESTAMSFSYKFSILPGAKPEKLLAAVERGNMVRFSINGQEIACSGQKHYLDFRIGVFDIDDYVREGENEIVIALDRYDIRFEPAAIILDGEFGVEARDGRFVICSKPETFTYGSWLDQKYYFYPNAFLYSYEVDLGDKPANAKLVLDKIETSCASVTVNGKYVGVIGRDGDNYALIAEQLHAGKNEITVRVCGSFRNLYGPYFNYVDQTVADPSQFMQYARDRINRAEEYDLLPYGLYNEPELYTDR